MSENLDLIRFSIHAKRYNQIEAIVAEAMGAATKSLLAQTLARHHGIPATSLAQDPLIYFTVDSQQQEDLRQRGAGSPTWAQLICSSRMFDLDRDRCIERFKAMVGDGGNALIT